MNDENTAQRKVYPQEVRHNATEHINKIIQDYVRKKFGTKTANIDHNITGVVLVYFDMEEGES